jgi:ankyrin repeat protein
MLLGCKFIRPAASRKVCRRKTAVFLFLTVGKGTGNNLFRLKKVAAMKFARLTVLAFAALLGAAVCAAPAGAAKPQTYTLLDAAAAGDATGAKALLARGADLNMRMPESGDTALMVAARNGYTGVVEVLLAAHASVNARNANDYTALIFAAQNGRRAVVAALLGAGAQPNTASKNGATALISAAAFGYPDIVKTLIKAGADVNAKAGNGYTALILSAQNGYTHTVEALIAAHADVNAKANDGNYALRAASKKGYWGICRLLKDAGAKNY